MKAIAKPSPKSDLPQGTLDLLILKIVAIQPVHGYAIAQRLQQISRDTVQVPGGSLYPALHRLESRGLLKSDWREADSGRDAKFYRLTQQRASSSGDTGRELATAGRSGGSDSEPGRGGCVMTWWSRLWRRNELEQDLGRELQFHIPEERLLSFKRTGLSEDEARRRVRQEFGGIEQVKEDCRDARRMNVLDDLGRDLRYTLRMLRKSPVFTAVAILSLALGIGANTAIFSLIDALLLRPLPVPHPDRLMSISMDAGNGRPEEAYFTYAMFDEIARQRGILRCLYLGRPPISNAFGF